MYMYDACMILGMDAEQYWRLSPQETHRWIEAKRPKKQIGNLSEDDLNMLAEKIHNDEEGIYL